MGKCRESSVSTDGEGIDVVVPTADRANGIERNLVACGFFIVANKQAVARDNCMIPSPTIEHAMTRKLDSGEPVRELVG